MLLAIDTSQATSAAVLRNGELLSLVSFGDALGHAENIGLAISAALTEAGVGAGELTGVAIGRGPASYTGLRVGMAAALAFARARSLPSYGVATLDAVATRFADGNPTVVTADARRRELFVGFYSGLAESGLAQRSGELVVMSPQQLEDRIGSERVIAADCDAGMVGSYAALAIAAGVDLSDVSALYLRTPDVTQSPRKQVGS